MEGNYCQVTNVKKMGLRGLVSHWKLCVPTFLTVAMQYLTYSKERLSVIVRFIPRYSMHT